MTLVSGRMITSKVTKSTFFGEKNIIPKLCIDFFSKLNFFSDFAFIYTYQHIGCFIYKFANIFFVLSSKFNGCFQKDRDDAIFCSIVKIWH